jgi:metal-responsive CopG/Arc/MetJ family transcriptional regulator
MPSKKTKSPKKHISVSLPRDLIEEVDRLISSRGVVGYNRSQFINESVRLRVQELGKYTNVMDDKHISPIINKLKKDFKDKES